jgi:predicted permease
VQAKDLRIASSLVFLMALVTDPEAPLREDLGATAGQSFDCEDDGTSRQLSSRKSCAAKIASSILLSVGVVLVLAFIGTEGVLSPEMMRKFAVSGVSPARVPTSSSQNTIPGSDKNPAAVLPPNQIPGDSVQPPARAPSPTMLSSSQQQVAMLFTIMGFGKLLQGRFPGKEANIVQKLLLQFIVPATLYKGLSSQTVALSQLSFVAAGAGMVLARYVCSWITARAVFGKSTDPETEALRRTGAFQISTMASALSVLPFVGEFVGPAYVGLGGLVDLPMKLYMLIVMPVLLKMQGAKSDDPAGGSSGGIGKTVSKLLSDPISLSLILGLATSAITGGQGLKALGFVGKAVDSLAGAQTAVLFLLIGLKLKLDSDSPLKSLVLLLGTQGALLVIASALCLAFPMSAAMQQFLLLFAQGSPSVVGLGVITAAATNGVKGYNSDFGFDIVALAFPISALLQCAAGVMGASYGPFAGVLGFAFMGAAVALRAINKSKFEAGGDKPAVAA